MADLSILSYREATKEQWNPTFLLYQESLSCLCLWVCSSNHLQKEKEDKEFHTKVKCDARELFFNFSLFLLELFPEQKNQ